MLIEVCHTFHLPEGSGMLVLLREGTPESIELSLPEDDVRITVPLPRKDDDAGWALGNGGEGWEARWVNSFEIRCTTEVGSTPAEGEKFEAELERAGEETLRSAMTRADTFVRTVRWRTGQFWLPDRISDRHGSQTSFHSAGKTISHGRARLTVVTVANEKLAADDDKWKSIADDLMSGRQAPLEERLLLDARLYRSQEDYRVALAWAAVALEVALAKVLRKRLTGIASKSQIDKFLDEMSNRLLSTVALRVFEIGDRQFGTRCSDVFEMRNSVLHGKRQSVSLAEATMAIDTAQAMINWL
jgi:hypothetical protein